MTPRSPTLDDIARALGVSKMTVSRALRGEPHVRAELRERVRATAEAMGYRPDPEIAKLMAYMRRQRRSAAAPRSLGFVWAERDRESLAQSSWPQQLWRGARERAERLGFQLDEFHLAGKGMTGRRLSEILEARGIPGFILSPLISRSRGHVSMRWERFASVVIGLGYARPALHRVHHHHYLGMMTALRMLKKLGHRRIGFYCANTINERMFGAWSASFLTHHPLPLAHAASLLALRRDLTRSDFLAWCRQARPEVVIDGGHLVADWIGEAHGAPGHVTLGWRADRPEIAGIDQQADVLGAAAVDLLVAQYQQNERGLPEHPKIVLTEGQWRDGASVAKRLR